MRLTNKKLCINRLMIILLIILMSIFAVSLSGIYSWSYFYDSNTEIQLTKLANQTVIPSKINLYLLAQDNQHHGIPDIPEDGFSVFQDHEPLNLVEGSFSIQKPTTVDINIVLLIDLSGSMAESDSLETIKETALHFIQHLQPNQALAIHTFAGTRTERISYTTDKALLTETIQSIEQFDGVSTNLHGSVYRCTQSLAVHNIFSPEYTRMSLLVVLTDGVDTAQDKTLSQVVSSIKSFNTQIITLGFGPQINENTLQTLGSCGSYTASSNTQLMERIPEIIHQIQSLQKGVYVFSLCTPLRQGWHTITTQVTYNDHSDKTLAYINASDFVDTVSEWQTSYRLLYPLSHGSLVTYEGYIYLIGGTGNDALDSVYNTRMYAQGFLGRWKSLATLPHPIAHPQGLYLNKGIYVIGSQEGTFYSEPDFQGNLSEWQSFAGFPDSISGNAVIALNTTIFAAGGRIHETNTTENSQAIITDRVYQSRVLEDGSISEWTRSGSLPEPLADYALVQQKTSHDINTNSIYIIGGKTQSGVSSHVWECTVSQSNPSTQAGENNPGDTTVIRDSSPFSNCKEITPLPNPLYGHSAVWHDRCLVVLGGFNGENQYQDTVFVNCLDEAGTLTTWQENRLNLPNAQAYHSSVSRNGFIYVIGGMTDQTLGSVLYAPIHSTNNLCNP